MPRQPTQYRRKPHATPDHFPQRLEWFQHASGLTWAEIARLSASRPSPYGAGGSGECVPLVNQRASQLSARQSGTNYAISFRLTRSEAVALAGALRSMGDSLAYDLDAKFPPAKDTD